MFRPKDIENMFNSEVAYKKKLSYGAHKRNLVGKGVVMTPSDFLTKKEREKMNGEVKTYSLLDRIPMNKFRALSTDDKMQRLKAIAKRYGASAGVFAVFFECSRKTQSNWMSENSSIQSAIKTFFYSLPFEEREYATVRGWILISKEGTDTEQAQAKNMLNNTRSSKGNRGRILREIEQEKEPIPDIASKPILEIIPEPVPEPVPELVPEKPHFMFEETKTVEKQTFSFERVSNEVFFSAEKTDTGEEIARLLQSLEPICEFLASKKVSIKLILQEER